MNSGSSSLSLHGAVQSHIQPIKFLGKGAKIPFLAVAASRTIFDLCNTRGRVGEEVDTVVSLCSLKPVALISKYSCLWKRIFSWH